LLYSQEYDIKPELVASVINAESNFDKDAKSSKGAIGLMQIMPKTAVYIAGSDAGVIDVKSLFESDTNIKLGCKYLSYLFDKFEDETVALASYNAGEGVVMRWLEDSRYSADKKTLKKIPYEETREYVAKVQKAKAVYKSKLKS
jgi:soluble lytic murein transglycosylase